MKRPKVKIIYILCHPPQPIIYKYKNPEDYFSNMGKGSYTKLDKFPYWVGFFSNDHHAVAAHKLNQLTDEFDIECWRIYGNTINQIYLKYIEGITHKVFPSYSVNIPQVGRGNFSPALLNYLIDYLKKNKVILNVSVGHAWFHIWLFFKLKKYKPQLPIVAVHLSGGFKIFNYYRLSTIKKIFKFYYLIEHKIDKKSLSLIDHYYIGSKIEADYLKDCKQINSSFYTGGVDFDYFKPSLDKLSIRHELGLPIDKKIMIVTGNFRSSDYGYHHLIECYKQIKTQHNDLQLIMVGGYKNEDLYDLGQQAGILMIERVKKETLLKFYQASDFYGQPAFGYGFINYGGFGFAMMEALACGLPIISQNIIHFPGTLEERNKIGFDMPTKEALIKNIIYLKDNFKKFTECRTIAQKYFDIKMTQNIYLNKYRELALKYFGIDTTS